MLSLMTRTTVKHITASVTPQLLSASGKFDLPLGPESKEGQQPGQAHHQDLATGSSNHRPPNVPLVRALLSLFGGVWASLARSRAVLKPQGKSWMCGCTLPFYLRHLRGVLAGVITSSHSPSSEILGLPLKPTMIIGWIGASGSGDRCNPEAQIGD